MSYDLSETIRVAIGTEPKTYLMQKVLECSILRRTDMKIEFYPLIGKEWEYEREGIQVGTGFSLRRWMIPAFFGWRGRAIYLDADQLVLSDIFELWQKFEAYPACQGASAWLTYQPDKFNKKPWPQSSVMLIDCNKACDQWGWNIHAIMKHLRKHPTKKAYADFMHCTWMEPPPCQIENGWNGLNIHNPGKTKLVHFTKEPEQPIYDPDHPLSYLWQKELAIAIKFKFIKQAEFEEALDNWGKQEDWRKQNGLHPYYRRYLKAFKEAA